MTTKTIRINGATHQVLNSLSSGPGLQAHTFEFCGGYVYDTAGTWRLQRPGEVAQVVTVQGICTTCGSPKPLDQSCGCFE